MASRNCHKASSGVTNAINTRKRFNLAVCDTELAKNDANVWICSSRSSKVAFVLPKTIDMLVATCFGTRALKVFGLNCFCVTRLPVQEASLQTGVAEGNVLVKDRLFGKVLHGLDLTILVSCGKLFSSFIVSYF
jgi:hypothetical protein